MLDNLLSLYKDMAVMATEWFVDKVRLISDNGYIHLCPVCQNDIHISDFKETNTQRVVTCKVCGSKYVTKVGKHRK
ncbi:hypothetical protein [Turicibacter sanguinis]|uniref:hypothetical protein n=1 Tax=Turicibacter sanguinis TaxID=154288 RepID=UPI0018AC0CCF|nr:hypothetical protein [Turicibacter sanguinis]MDB8553863.1 hypothetical protein [Turicibacter sanguinis]